jgi:hypothetical protein
LASAFLVGSSFSLLFKKLGLTELRVLSHIEKNKLKLANYRILIVLIIEYYRLSNLNLSIACVFCLALFLGGGSGKKVLTRCGYLEPSLGNEMGVEGDFYRMDAVRVCVSWQFF